MKHRRSSRRVRPIHDPENKTHSGRSFQLLRMSHSILREASDRRVEMPRQVKRSRRAMVNQPYSKTSRHCVASY